MIQADLFDQEHIALRKQAEAIRESIQGSLSVIRMLEAKAVECCPHTDRKTTRTYFEGSYYDKAYTEYVVKCNFCGKVLDTRKEECGWYG